RCVASDPVGWRRAQATRLQPAVGAALGDVDHVLAHVLANHVPRRPAGVVAAADAQAVALAQGVIHRPLMRADAFAPRRAQFARARREVVGEETAEIALANEADAGGILLCRGGQPDLTGQAAYLRLFQRPDREQRGGQLPLVQRV